MVDALQNLEIPPELKRLAKGLMEFAQDPKLLENIAEHAEKILGKLSGSSGFPQFLKQMSSKEAQDALSWLKNPAIKPEIKFAYALNFIMDMAKECGIPGVGEIMNDLRGLGLSLPIFDTIDAVSNTKSNFAKILPDHVTSDPHQLAAAVEKFKTEGLPKELGIKDPKAAGEFINNLEAAAKDGKIEAPERHALEGILAGTQIPPQEKKPRTELTAQQKKATPEPPLNPDNHLNIGRGQTAFYNTKKFDLSKPEDLSKLGLTADSKIPVMVAGADGTSAGIRLSTPKEIAEAIGTNLVSLSPVVDKENGIHHFNLTGASEAGKSISVAATHEGKAMFAEEIPESTREEIKKFQKDGTVPSVEVAPGVAMNMGMDPKLMGQFLPQQIPTPQFGSGMNG